MRVHLTREVKQIREGLFKRKAYQGVLLQVEFSEQELAIIKQSELETLQILEVGPDPLFIKKNKKLLREGPVKADSPLFNLRVKNLLPEKRRRKPPVFARYYPSKLEADQLEAGIREKMPLLKDHIAANGVTVEEGTDTFDL